MPVLDPWMMAAKHPDCILAAIPSPSGALTLAGPDAIIAADTVTDGEKWTTSEVSAYSRVMASYNLSCNSTSKTLLCKCRIASGSGESSVCGQLTHGGHSHEMGLIVTSTAQLHAWMDTDADAWDNIRVKVTEPPCDRIVTLAQVVDFEAKEHRLYIDGVLQGAVSFTGSMFRQDPGSVRFAFYGPGFSYTQPPGIEVFRTMLFEGAMSAGEISFFNP